MKIVQKHIETAQDELSQHSFFRRLRDGSPLAETLPFASALTFWAMAFQDALRLNAAAVEDPQLRRIARHHLHEDRGHDRWFLQDLELITGSRPDVTALFAPEHGPARGAVYALLAESFRAESDIERIVLLLTFESTGQVFFPRVVEYLSGMGVEPVFQYFSQKHLDVERDHEIVERQMRDLLGAIPLAAGDRDRCLGLVDRCYRAFAILFDALEQAIRDEPAAGRLRFTWREHLLRERATAVAAAPLSAAGPV